MCNLTADTTEELHAFARRLDIDRKHFLDDFIDLYKVSCETRKLAIELGAIAVKYREEPWRCAGCYRSTLPHTKILKCKCKEPQTRSTS